MAVLKSPKNVKRKPLWSSKLRQSTKKNLFYFYEEENRYQVSPRHSYAVRKDHIMDAQKYRRAKDAMETPKALTKGTSKAFSKGTSKALTKGTSKDLTKGIS